MRLKLHHFILIGLIVGAGAGLAARAMLPPGADGAVNPKLAWIVTNVAEPVGQVFMRLIFMICLPLVFTALVLGVAGMGDLRKLGRVGLRTLVLTIILSSVSVLIGVTLARTVQPGASLPAEKRAALMERFHDAGAATVGKAQRHKPLRDILLEIIPRNPLQEMVGALDGSSPGGGMIAVMFFAVMFGVGITLSAPPRVAGLVAALEGVYEAVMVVIGLAMKLAPIGVAGLMFAVTAALGFDILRTLLLYMGVVLAGLALHTFVVYPVLLILVARVKPWRFFARISEAALTAFATSSSSATLPTALRVTEKRLGVRRDVTSFVLTVGATANQNGTALYEGVTVLFLAQVFGVDLSIQSQVLVVLMSVIAGIGTAGIPGGSLPLIAIVLQSVGVPGEGIAIILGVDRLLDMCRTAVNVIGDIAIAACVDRLEGGAPGSVPEIEDAAG